MPRQKRLLSNSGIYHVMLRRNEGKDLFCNDEDRKRFLDTISRMGSKKNMEYFHIA